MDALDEGGTIGFCASACREFGSDLVFLKLVKLIDVIFDTPVNVPTKDESLSSEGTDEVRVKVGIEDVVQLALQSSYLSLNGLLCLCSCTPGDSC